MCKPGRGPSPGTELTSILVLDFLSSRTMRNTFLLVKSLCSLCFIMATRAKTYANSEITTTGRNYFPWARSTVIRACSHLKQIGTVATCPFCWNDRRCSLSKTETRRNILTFPLPPVLQSPTRASH